MPEDQVARLYTVHGRVQGVGFRYSVEQWAHQFGIGGHVRNRADGTVEVYAVGTQDRLELLRERLRSGPRMAFVERVDEREAEMRPVQGFRVTY